MTFFLDTIAAIDRTRAALVEALGGDLRAGGKEAENVLRALDELKELAVDFHIDALKNMRVSRGVARG